MPIYEYDCCTRFERFVRNSAKRDRVACACGKRAVRRVSSFSIGNQTYVAGNLKNIEFGTGVRNLETVAAADRALKEAGVEPVDAYYRAPKPPPAKEVTMVELAPYLDGMPLDNEPVRE